VLRGKTALGQTIAQITAGATLVAVLRGTRHEFDFSQGLYSIGAPCDDVYLRDRRGQPAGCQSVKSLLKNGLTPSGGQDAVLIVEVLRK
jgi:hypothetical protein